MCAHSGITDNVKDALHCSPENRQNIILARRCGLKNKIEAIRNERGIRQDELAKALGVSRQTISSLENGRYNPSILLAYKIAKLFDMTIEEVFCFEEEE